MAQVEEPVNEQLQRFKTSRKESDITWNTAPQSEHSIVGGSTLTTALHHSPLTFFDKTTAPVWPR
jgi:hypothetical protein